MDKENNNLNFCSTVKHSYIDVAFVCMMKTFILGDHKVYIFHNFKRDMAWYGIYFN